MANPPSAPDRVLARVWDARDVADRLGQPELVAALNEVAAEVEAWKVALRENIYRVEQGIGPDEPPTPWFERQRREAARIRNLVSLDAERARRRLSDRVG